MQKLNTEDTFKIAHMSLIIFLLSALLAIPTWIGLVMIVINRVYYIGNKSRIRFLLKLLINVVVTLVLMIISGTGIRLIGLSLISSYIAYMKYDVKADFTKSKHSMFMLIAPLFTMAIVEFAQGNMDFALEQMFLGHKHLDLIGNHIAFWVTYILIFTSQYVLSGILGSKKVGVLIVTNIILVLGLINMIVLKITSSPLLPTDIYILKTAMSVMNQQKIEPLLVISCVLYILACVCLNIDIIKELKNEAKTKISKRIASVILGITILASITSYINTIDFLTFRSNMLYGFPFHFLIECRTTLNKPKGYEETGISTELNESTSKENKPNIVFIMSEAFSDLEETYGLEATEDVIPYFNELRKTYPNGLIYSSVIGNNTVSSEFESLTGISTAFSDKGSNIYQKYLSDNLYTAGSLYKQMGYKTAVVHGSLSSNYNRGNVYKTLGYDELVFENKFSKDTEFVRYFISDKSNFNEISKLIDKSDEPIFIMNITMQNHGDYTDEQIDTINKIEVTDLNNREVNNYLSLINQTDIYLKDFLESLTEPTLVVIYGDHQPMIRNDFYDSLIGDDIDITHKVTNYEIPYLIWSNFDTNTDYKVPGITSMNYLPLIVNDYLGYERTEWYDLLDETRKSFPVITNNFIIDINGKVHDTTAVKARLGSGEKLNDKEKTLQKYQYSCYELVTR